MNTRNDRLFPEFLFVNSSFGVDFDFIAFLNFEKFGNWAIVLNAAKGDFLKLLAHLECVVQVMVVFIWRLFALVNDSMEDALMG